MSLRVHHLRSRDLDPAKVIGKLPTAPIAKLYQVQHSAESYSERRYL